MFMNYAISYIMIIDNREKRQNYLLPDFEINSFD